MTLYEYVDNTPPNATICKPVIHQKDGDNGGTVTLNPAENLPVDTTPIYNVSTRKYQAHH